MANFCLNLLILIKNGKSANKSPGDTKIASIAANIPS